MVAGIFDMLLLLISICLKQHSHVTPFVAHAARSCRVPCSDLRPSFVVVVVQGGDEPARVEIEQQKFLSALPFLPPLTEKTLNTYYTIYGVFFMSVIVFGALLAPLLEVRIGVGGEQQQRGHTKNGCYCAVMTTE